MCRCAQRRALLTESMGFLARGDLPQVRANASAFVLTVTADASDMARVGRQAVATRLAAAHGRLRV